jgi:hypothetical protein
MITKEHRGTKNGFKNYKEPAYVEFPLRIRVYCAHKDCYTYIFGTLGYNGAFKAEGGETADLKYIEQGKPMLPVSDHNNWEDDNLFRDIVLHNVLDYEPTF